jgi:hypothetical protein
MESCQNRIVIVEQVPPADNNTAGVRSTATA